MRLLVGGKIMLFDGYTNKMCLFTKAISIFLNLTGFLINELFLT